MRDQDRGLHSVPDDFQSDEEAEVTRIAQAHGLDPKALKGVLYSFQIDRIGDPKARKHDGEMIYALGQMLPTELTIMQFMASDGEASDRLLADILAYAMFAGHSLDSESKRLQSLIHAPQNAQIAGARNMIRQALRNSGLSDLPR